MVDKVDKLVVILGGEIIIVFYLEFFIRNNYVDLFIFKNIKVFVLCIYKFFRGWCLCICVFGWWRKIIIFFFNFSFRIVYEFVIWCWYNLLIRVIKGILYICILYLFVFIFYVIFSYLFDYFLVVFVYFYDRFWLGRENYLLKRVVFVV